MKKSFVVLLGLMAIVFDVFAQEEFPTDDEGNTNYNEVVNVGNTADEEFKKRALSWINEYYKNPSGVIQSQDGNKIEGRAQFRLVRTDKKGNELPAGKVSYNFKIEFKDGRYRYEFYKVAWQQSTFYDVNRWFDQSQVNYDAETFNSYITQTQTYFDETIEALVDKMSVAEVKKSNDW